MPRRSSGFLIGRSDRTTKDAPPEHAPAMTIISPLDFILSDADWLARKVQPRNERESRRIERVRDEILENSNIIAMLAKGSNALDDDFSLSPGALNLTEVVIRPLVIFFERLARRQKVELRWEFPLVPKDRVLVDAVLLRPFPYEASAGLTTQQLS